MKKGLFFKVTSALLATALVTTSVLIYVDKKSANASKKVTAKATIDTQVTNAMESFDEVSVNSKSKSKTYTMEVDGNKVTFDITDTATGRKVIQTNESNNEYTEVNLNNGIMTVTTGEKIGGKYVSKKSNVCNLEEETDKVAIEENNTSESNRVSCLALGKSYWYEKDDKNINIGKSSFKKDLDHKAFALDGLAGDNLKNINSYQKYVDKSSKNWQKAKENLRKNLHEESKCAILAMLSVAGYYIAEAIVMTALCSVIVTLVLALIVIVACIPAAVKAAIYSAKLFNNFVKGMYNGCKAGNVYKKIIA